VVKNEVKVSQNFVAFSEYMNFSNSKSYRFFKVSNQVYLDYDVA